MRRIFLILIMVLGYVLTGGGDCGLSDDSSAGDRRLANVKELQSLIDFGMYNPALPSGHPFTGVASDHYWSSTTVADDTNYACAVELRCGRIYHFLKTSIPYVWPVRGGQ